MGERSDTHRSQLLISMGFAKAQPVLQAEQNLPLEDQSGHAAPTNPGDPPVTRSVSTRELVLIFAAIAVGLVLGYLFLNKLVDMSQEEDCALAHRNNC